MEEMEEETRTLCFQHLKCGNRSELIWQIQNPKIHFVLWVVLTEWCGEHAHRKFIHSAHEES
jgi:hypothetical protein